MTEQSNEIEKGGEGNGQKEKGEACGHWEDENYCYQIPCAWNRDT